MRAAIAVLFVAGLSAQAPPAFDLADVHVSPPANGPIIMLGPGKPLTGGRYELRRATMVELIRMAYGVEPDNVIGGPSWLEWDRFDVVARSSPATSPEASRLMLQSLLADRFKLVAHKDTKPVPAFVLSLGKGKPKLKESDGSGDSGCRAHPDGSGFVTFVCHNMAMEAFVERLRTLGGPYFDLPVVDATGLKGGWDFEIGWTPRRALERSGGDGVSVFQAVDQQLGLKLEQKSVPMPVIVVDRVNRKPTENAAGVAAKLEPAPNAEFEVASLKLSEPDEEPGGEGVQPGGKVDFRAFPLGALISIAWDLDPRPDLAGAPKWLGSTQVDLVAKAPKTSETLTLRDLMPMLKTLLTERFQMKTHFEDREVDAYTLVSVKPKLQKADPAARTRCKTERVPPTPSSPPVIHATCQNMTMAQFAEELRPLAPSYLHYSVPDATGIEGAFDFSFSFSLAPPGGGGGGRNGGGRKGGGPPADSASDTAMEPSGAMSLFDALTRQLGLKLEMQKRTVPVFVIDHMEPKPTEN
jgi:uncharacterized protein (TIGR03435 family)